jgi:hypothetical protein
VSKALVTTEIHLPLDVERDLSTEVTLNHVVFNDNVPEPDDLSFIKVYDPDVRIHIGFTNNPDGLVRADSIDIGQCDLYPLTPG